MESPSLWEVVTGLAAAAAFWWSNRSEAKLEAHKQLVERDLAAHRSRLDQLDRVHSRRVEQIEELYSAVEEACWMALPQNPPAPAQGRAELDSARKSFRRARIYLDDATADLCKMIFGKCGAAILRAEHMNKVGTSAIDPSWERLWKLEEEGQRHLDELRVRLQSALVPDESATEARRRTGTSSHAIPATTPSSQALAAPRDGAG